ncbi:hypothetical protein [Actinocrispum wychmicini]|uniref:hypothetical protein n=1 Tax=Actinocrispum wychmicini TaxID=1213861 RepID=UPI00140427CF|nr:hypothetical protein [Actinocrispum wychmicini]
MSGRPLITFEPWDDDIPEVDGVLVCASSQSPWEHSVAPSAWTALVRRAGFGITLPFQAEPAVRIGRLLAGRDDGAWLINACFPDAVNPLLAALGVPVLCGIGNIALLAASAQAGLGLPDQSRLRLLAHHRHLREPGPDEQEVLAWQDDQPIEDVRSLLAAQRATGRAELNDVTGHAAALLVTGMLAGKVVDTNLPGPLGMPGGYPVRLHGTELTLRLPAGVSESEAVAYNQRAAAADGVVVADGGVTFGVELAGLAPELADGFGVDELPAATAALYALRERLRGEKPG